MSAAPAADLRLHLDFWRTGLSAALSPRVAYARGEVPGLEGISGTTPPIYGLLSIRRRAYEPQPMDDHPDVSGWTLTVFGAGRTVAEAAWVLNKVTSTYENESVQIGGHLSTPCRIEPGADIDIKNRVASGSLTVNYVL